MAEWGKNYRESSLVDDRRHPLRQAEDQIDDITEVGREFADLRDTKSYIEKLIASGRKPPGASDRIDESAYFGRAQASRASDLQYRSLQREKANPLSKKELDEFKAIANQGSDVWPPGQAPTDVLKPMTSWMMEQGEDYGPPMPQYGPEYKPQYGPEYKPKRLMDGDIHFPNADKFHPDLW